MSVVDVKSLYAGYNSLKVIENLSFSIEKGEKAALVGDSGTGKSTLLNILMGFHCSESGNVKILDHELNKDNIQDIRKQISFLPQEVPLPQENVREIFERPFGFKANKEIKPDEEEIKSIFDTFGLDTGLLGKHISEISGGQKQRIALASCLLLKKPVLFLDEPTSALDENAIDSVIKYLIDLKEVTVLSASHNKQWVESADKIIDLNGGNG